ncbi:hypothetical protein PVK06_008472 [Gossypium arboreum]|uniref:Uncharacterized protein n=1 Tax=Gossypium arboreum TaxID=29729 RepID=A0ABR0QK23_GOSAR|nr:hypothetical protein PVK06_008472 [Gossypium arboreum]
MMRQLITFVQERTSRHPYFEINQWLALRTSHFEDGGNDVSTLGAFSNTNQELIELPKGPMTQAQTKQFQDALSALVMRILEENKALDVGEAMDTLLKTQCTLLQADFSSSRAPPA